MPCTTFHVNIQARPPRTAEAGCVELDGRRFAALSSESAGGPPLFSRTFEEAAAALAELPRLYVEPDGAFVWVASSGSAWQLDGTLYDGGGRLWYVEIKGNCLPEALDQLLSALGWPETPVAFQLVRQAVLLDEAEFRSYAFGRRAS